MARKTIRDFSGGLVTYQSELDISDNQFQKFDNAIQLCNDLMNEFDGKMKNYYTMWIERCEFMKTQPLEPDWNGVFIATTK